VTCRVPQRIRWRARRLARRGAEHGVGRSGGLRLELPEAGEPVLPGRAVAGARLGDDPSFVGGGAAMFGDALRIAMGMASEASRQRRHEFLTTEHLLLGLLREPRACEILEACGADLKALERDLVEYLDGIQGIEVEGDYQPIQTLGF